MGITSIGEATIKPGGGKAGKGRGRGFTENSNSIGKLNTRKKLIKQVANIKGAKRVRLRTRGTYFRSNHNTMDNVEYQPLAGREGGRIARAGEKNRTWV